MFSGCIALTNINLSSFKTPKVTDMSMMFIYCSNLNNLNLSSFDVKNSTDITSMFHGCKKNIILSNIDKFFGFEIMDLIKDLPGK